MIVPDFFKFLCMLVCLKHVFVSVREKKRLRWCPEPWCMEVIKRFGTEDGRKCVSVTVCLCLTAFASGLMHLSLSHVFHSATSISNC